MAVRFPTTRWTLVRGAVQGDEAARREALDALFDLYWRPVYLYLRRRGLDRENAEDAVQGTFAYLYEHGFPGGADPGRGRLRNYLRTAVDHYLINRHAHATAARRGGKTPPLPLDTEAIERLLPHTPPEAEAAYQQEWAVGLMARALHRLRAEYHQGKRVGHPEVILRYFEFDEAPTYAEGAAASGMSVPRFKACLHRARGRFREILREEVASTTLGPGSVEREMADLLRILGSQQRR